VFQLQNPHNEDNNGDERDDGGDDANDDDHEDDYQYAGGKEGDRHLNDGTHDHL